MSTSLFSRYLARKPARASILAGLLLGLWSLTLSASAQISGPGSTIPWNGNNWYLYGVDYPWYNYATDFGSGGWGKYTDWTAINSAFSAMNAEGARIQRWWVFGDGRYDPKFNADGTVSGLDSQFFTDVDTALQKADANNQYLLFCVIDNSMWANANVVSGVQLGGHAAIISDSTVQQSFLDNALKPFLQHVAASPYASRVLGYDIVNEPEGQMTGYWGGDANFAAAPVQAFVANCASTIHTYGGGAYATVGSAMPGWASLWSGLGLDFYQIHYYPWMDNGGPAGSGLPTYASLNLDRPCVVGEFSTVDADYTIGSTTAQSAQWYLDTIYRYGYAGALAWSNNASDSATDWTDFNPVFANWANGHSGIIGPQPSSAPAPVLSALKPTSANAGGPAFTLVVKGSSFASGDVVDWTAGGNTTALTTTFVSSAELKAGVPASLIANAGTAQINVTGTGGVSASKKFTILLTTL
ncbi:MAG TPA: cellulase family glycosylhydrolase, partial [Chthonomonadaceae bacterium]|nr:cellulase family glycosylhydrolase [Chthonomonadaceae bacterium]